jgi:hypothetical protein
MFRTVDFGRLMVSLGITKEPSNDFNKHHLSARSVCLNVDSDGLDSTHELRKHRSRSSGGFIL